MRDSGLLVGGGSTLPADLAEPSGDPWAGVDVPDGWDDVAAIAAQVAADLEPLTDRIVARVREEVDGYRPPAPVPDEDFRGSVTNNMQAILLGLAERRRPHPEEITARRELGSRRAQQGLPVDAVLTAYQVGYRELWADLVEALPSDAPHTTRKLLSAATLVWGWVQEVSDAIGVAHASTSRRLEARRVSARQRLVELLHLDDVGDAEAVRLVRSLGFDPEDRFQVTVVAGSSDDLAAIELQRHADELGGHHAVVARGPLVIAVTQATDVTALTEAARAAMPDATIASGAVRRGLAGARASLADAELALAVTPTGTSADFEDVWLWATLTGSQPRLAELLTTGTRTAASHPHLVAAVTAFADHFSVSEAARQLELHANTVKYRLDRWAELTGWDARTFTGLARSLAAIRLGDVDRP